MYEATTAGFTVTVVPEYLTQQSDEETGFYLYSYKIDIRNQSGRSARLIRRWWIIRDGKGVEEVVEGNGVIGQQPLIAHGGSFSYTSGCPLNTPTGNMRGHYVMQPDHGSTFTIRVPLFFLRPTQPRPSGTRIIRHKYGRGSQRFRSIFPGRNKARET